LDSEVTEVPLRMLVVFTLFPSSQSAVV